jgi:hypothetical protein
MGPQTWILFSGSHAAQFYTPSGFRPSSSRGMAEDFGHAVVGMGSFGVRADDPKAVSMVFHYQSLYPKYLAFASSISVKFYDCHGLARIWGQFR